MIDFHTHILPQLDDGSSSLAMSLKLCDALKEQGIDLVAATPHFYANGKENIPAFLARRDASYARLAAALAADAPRILCGAEVHYYDGMYASQDIAKLCLEGTRLLLVEMPMTVWSRRMLDGLILLQETGVQVVLAHIDRYFYQKARVFADLSDAGILFQANADALLRFGTRRKLLQMFRRGQIAFLGSDCHNDTARSPRIGEAITLLRTKLGDPATERLEAAQSFFITAQETAR